MRWTLAIIVLVGLAAFATSGCFGRAKHLDGPGNSENAPGHNKHK